MTPPTAVTPALAAACFSPTYVSARARFALAADRAGARLDIFTHDTAHTPDGGTLSTDVAVLGAPDADNALLIISGTHGPEGFVGSAAQIGLLNRLALEGIPPNLRIVLVHAINPWGFANISRTTENNVDLNRNFIDWAQPAPTNAGYHELHGYLCPDDWTPEALQSAEAARQGWIKQNGDNAYVDVTARGQYSHADGLHYGGAGREWSNHTLEALIKRHLGGVRRLALIDWHTGLGERGEPFFLCFNEPGDAGWQRACKWWGRDRVETQGGFEGANRPNYQGLLFHGVQRYAASAEVTGAVIEFGTRSREDMRIALRGDHQLKFGGTLSDAQRAALREQLLDAFAPFSLQWQCSVLAHAIDIQRQAMQGCMDWR